ncbi:MAG TPA: ABC transporter permease [Anaerolineales bacterium]|nr:ABC transporter permease [Anaerolineales bacterium]
MTTFSSAFYTESLKVRRSILPWLTTLGFSLAPLMGGLFMIIMKDPEAARNMGLLSAKAQMTMGVADWPTYFGLLAQATAIGGGILFSIITSWVFGREFSDRTVKDLMALPTSRGTIVTAKMIVISVWALLSVVWVFGLGLIVGKLVDIPGWSMELLRQSFVDVILITIQVLLLASPVAFFATMGRGYLPPMGWAIFSIFLAQIAAALGWGDWFPWSVPALFSGMAGPRAELLGFHSYVMVVMASAIGIVATFYWWRNADQTK